MLFWKLSSAENILIRFIYLNVCDIIFRNVIKNRTRRIGAVQKGITAFNSEDKYYKSKKGAVETGETVKFRIIVPRSFGANSARFSLRGDSQENYESKGMYWAGMYGDSHEVWDIEAQN